MMKEAVYATVSEICPTIDGRVVDETKSAFRIHATYSAGMTPYCEMGDRVKLIILKGDD